MPEKKLWLLERECWGYDEWIAFVVLAESAREARKIAGEYDVEFASPKTSKCSAIKTDGISKVILGSFNPG